jgi:lipoyl(octanoyl) transferase
VKLAKPSELVGFVRVIEDGLIAVCRELGINTQQISGRSGVWVRDERGDRKIAAIGIRVAQGVSMHGFALNVNPELAAFNRIIPCGINDAAVTSMADELSRDISVNEVIPVVEKYLLESLMKVSA